MENQPARFVEFGHGAKHVRADRIAAVWVLETGDEHQVIAQLSAAGSGWEVLGPRFVDRKDAVTAARVLCRAVTEVTGVAFVAVGDTAQFVRADRVVMVQTELRSGEGGGDSQLAWVTTVLLDAEGGRKGYSCRRVPAADAGDGPDGYGGALDAANLDRERILATLG